MATRVIIAEDNWLTPTVLRTELEAHGYEVVGIARTGTEAVELCREHTPDVVLMDIRMPEMSGIEATRLLMEECPACVVMVTGDTSLVVTAEEIGAMDYLVKPFMPDEIVTVVDIAQKRFARFMAIREASVNPHEALQTWQFVQRATKWMKHQERLTEDAAFLELERLARERGTTMRAVAEGMLRVTEAPSA